MDVTIACACPLRDGQARHPDGDTVTLRDTLDFRARRTILQSIRAYHGAVAIRTPGEALAILSEDYLFLGIESWTLLDAKGKPLPPTRENILAVLMADDRFAMPVADAADDLYAETILPLLTGASRSSSASPTDRSTSATTNGSTPHPKRSRRSSTSTTPTAAIEPTRLSPVGASSS